MAVRNAQFWNSAELQVRTTWKKEIEGVEIDFSMNNSLKDNFERNVGCSGPHDRWVFETHRRVI